MRILRMIWSRWGVLLLLALLALINSFYTAAAARQSLLSGPPGEVLYAAGFDGFEDEWQQSAGRDSHQIVDGVMRVNVQTPNVVYAASKALYGDFDATVTFRTTGGSEQNEGAGLIFRLQEAGCDMPLPLLCDLAQVDVLSVPLSLLRSKDYQTGYYVFLVSNDGYYVLGKYENTARGKGLVFKTVWHDGGDLINTGLNVDNRVRVVGRGNQFQFFINGRAVELCVPKAGEQPTGSARDCQGDTLSVWQDSDYPTGKLGVVVHTQQQPGTIADFDAFTVIMPRDTNDTPGAEI